MATFAYGNDGITNGGKGLVRTKVRTNLDGKKLRTKVDKKRERQNRKRGRC